MNTTYRLRKKTGVYLAGVLASLICAQIASATEISSPPGFPTNRLAFGSNQLDPSWDAGGRVPFDISVSNKDIDFDRGEGAMKGVFFWQLWTTAVNNPSLQISNLEKAFKNASGMGDYFEIFITSLKHDAAEKKTVMYYLDPDQWHLLVKHCIDELDRDATQFEANLTGINHPDVEEAIRSLGSEFAGDNAAGFCQIMVALRDKFFPEALLCPVQKVHNGPIMNGNLSNDRYSTSDLQRDIDDYVAFWKTTAVEWDMLGVNWGNEKLQWPEDGSTFQNVIKLQGGVARELGIKAFNWRIKINKSEGGSSRSMDQWKYNSGPMVMKHLDFLFNNNFAGVIFRFDWTEGGALIDALEEYYANLGVETENGAPSFNGSSFDGANATMGAAYSESIAGSASDPENDAMTFALVSGPSWLKLQANGSLSGLPGADDIGANNWTVQVSAKGGSDTASLNIKVDESGNDALTAHAGADQTVTAPAGGTASVTLNASASTGAIVFYRWKAGDAILGKGEVLTVDLGVGTHEIRLKVKDAEGNQTFDYVTITVVEQGGQNAAPSFSSDPVQVANATAGISYTASVAGSAFDPDGDLLTYTKKTGAAWLTVASNGTLSGAPGAGDAGLNSFTLEVSDGKGGTDTATLNITVVEREQQNEAPSFSSNPITAINANEGSFYNASIAGLASDPDGDLLTYIKKAGAGWLSVAADGTLTGTPGAGDAGLNSFTVEVADGNGGAAQATLNITVIPAVTGNEGELLNADFDEDEEGFKLNKASHNDKNKKVYEGEGSLAIKRGGSVERSISTVGYSRVELSVALRTDVYDADDVLLVQWFDGRAWNTAYEFKSSINKTFDVISISLPSGADNNPAFAVRFENDSDRSNEKAYVDSLVLKGIK